jgi:hypothetical protein
MAWALATLFTVAIVTPVRSCLEAFVERHFAYSSGRLGPFEERVRSYIELNDRDALVRSFLTEAVAALGATGGAIWLDGSAGPQLVARAGDWVGSPAVEIAFGEPGGLSGRLGLDPRPDGMAYPIEETAMLERLSRTVARALALAHAPTPWPAGKGSAA